MQQNPTDYKPTPSEKKLLEVLTNPDNRMKNITQICSMANINRTTYYVAIKKPEFRELQKQIAREIFASQILPIAHSFIQEAKRGSFQHGKVILEMAGLYTEKQKVDADVKADGQFRIIFGKPEGNNETDN